MGDEEEKKPNRMIYLVPDLLEEIFLRLPLKSILKFKTVSTQWRSILESRSFAERRRMIMNKVQKRPQILAAAGNHQQINYRRVNESEKEVEIVYLHCDAATRRPSLTCEGLVCIAVPGWVNVLNPSTGEIFRFPSGPDPVKTNRYDHLIFDDPRWDFFPGYWAMGFGRDKVNGHYKVVRMFFDTNQFDILDVNIGGAWRKLRNPAPYYVEFRIKSAFVNGSIYWYNYLPCKILALDLHTEIFRDVPTPPYFPMPAQLVNLEGRLAIVSIDNMIRIWSMDTKEETWSKTYSVPLFSVDKYPRSLWLWCKPLAVSKQGKLFLYDNHKRLFSYCPNTEEVNLIAVGICVLSPFVEDLIPLGRSDSTPENRTYGIQSLDQVPSSRISKLYRRIESLIPNILLTTSVAALVIFRYCIKS